MLNARSRWRRPPLALAVGFALLLLMVAGSLYLALRLADNTQRTIMVSDYRRSITYVLSAARDAEIGQRGFLITSDPKYLAPYYAAARALKPAVGKVARFNGVRGATVAAHIRPIIAAKFAEMDRTILLEKAGRHDAAVHIVRSDVGLRLMDRLRAIAEGERQWGLAESDRASANSVMRVRELTAVLVAGMVALIALMLLWLRQVRRQLVELDGARHDAERALAATQAEAASREAAEGQLRQLQKMESIGQLTGGIAHDFNNMLAVIMGSLELATRRLRSDPAKAAQLLESAREGAVRAAALTARLLAFSRRQPLAPTPIDANKFVGGMSEMLTRTLGEAIAVETVLAAGLWRCYADPGELENTLLNLAVNARDAMPDGGKLTIETTNAEIDDRYALAHTEVEPGQYVAICVTDTGIGMTPEVIEYAFDPFFTTKDVGKGTGLGLSQVFGFVKQSGGHIAIYSEVGEGTTIKLYLRRFTGVETRAMEAVPEAVPRGATSEIILVVEDEQRVRDFAADALHELGYTAIAVASPAEALPMIADRDDIALLFTDVVMPGMNGRVLADRAREVRGDLKILFTTGYTRNAVVHNGTLDIGVALLSKPYSLAELGRKVRQVIDGGGINRPS